MKANNFIFTVLAGLTTLAAWELLIKPRLEVQQQPEATSGVDWWPF
jgi:hypothetical protein